MTLPTIIPGDFLPPGTAHQFNYLRAAGALVNLPFMLAVIATKSAAGTAVVGQIYDATDAPTTDLLAGQSSEGAIMLRQAYLCSQLFQGGPAIKVVFVAEPGGGTANVQTMTVTGTASQDDTGIYQVAGRTFVVPSHAQDSASTFAAAIAAQFNAKAEQLPVLVTVASGVVTLTHPTKGVNGKDVKIIKLKDPAGLSVAIATTATGAGAADIQPGLDAFSPLRYDGIVTANHTTADITEILADIALRWAVTSKTWAHYFMFELGTMGTATTLAAAANHQAVVIGNYEQCPNAPGEGAITLGMLTFSRARPNSSYDKAVVPLYQPPLPVLFTPTEQNTGIHAGLTVFTGVISSAGQQVDQRSKVVELVTTKTTTNSQPDDRNRDIAVSRTGISLALQLDIATEGALGADANPTGINEVDAIPLVLDVMAEIMRAEAAAVPPVLDPTKVEADIQNNKVEPDGSTLGRLNALLNYHPALPFHQVGYQHNVIVGG